MNIKLYLKWLYIFLSFLFILSCKGQNKEDNIASITSKENIKKDELYNGKIFYSGDELNEYTFITSSDINKKDSLTYSIYKKNNEGLYVFSIEKLIANIDKEKYKIFEIIKFKDYTPENTQVKIIQEEKGYTVLLNVNNKTIKEWNFDKNIKVQPYENYLSILLFSYLKEGINAKNVVSQKSKTIIESNISKYTHQPDFYKDSFFKRESKIIDNAISDENMKIWKLCNEKLDFSKVTDANELESDWRYPYKEIKSLGIIYNLYSNSSYGDSFEGETLSQQMALYMYFLSWKERKIIYDEIDKLKIELSQNK